MVSGTSKAQESNEEKAVNKLLNKPIEKAACGNSASGFRVEAAGLLARAGDWQWGSLWNWRGGKSVLKLSLIARLPSWVDHVNTVATEAERKKMKRCIERSSPLGREEWVESPARRLNLESTLRPRGRPRKLA